MSDPQHTDRFAHFRSAQQGVMNAVRDELQSGHKRSHWMWFIFPQLAGLGHSPMAQKYALQSLNEAKAYLADEELGGRLRDCTQWVLGSGNPSVDAIFGYPDNLKFHSSMTLFAQVAGPDSCFHQALDRFFQGLADENTLRLLKQT